MATECEDGFPGVRQRGKCLVSSREHVHTMVAFLLPKRHAVLVTQREAWEPLKRAPEQLWLMLRKVAGLTRCLHLHTCELPPAFHRWRMACLEGGSMSASALHSLL